MTGLRVLLDSQRPLAKRAVVADFGEHLPGMSDLDRPRNMAHYLTTDACPHGTLTEYGNYIRAAQIR